MRRSSAVHQVCQTYLAYLSMHLIFSFYLEVALILLGWEYALSGHGVTIKVFLLCKGCRKNLVPGVGGSF